MANETILKENLTPVVTNNDSVSKEETIMGTTTMNNNNVTVIEFAVAEQLKNRLEVKGIHSDGYLAKTEIGEILGLSKKKVNASKREELLNILKTAVEEAYKSEKKSKKTSKKSSTKKEEAKVEEKKVDKAKCGTIDDKIMYESAKCSMLLRRLEIENENSKYYMTNEMIGIELGLSKEEISSLDRNVLIEKLKIKLVKYLHDERIRMGKEIDKPKTTAKIETKDKTPQEKLNTFIEDLRYASLKNKDKGYGTTVSGFMLDALILKQYGIDNLKEALKNDAITRKTGKGNIIVTEEKINKIKEIKKWLISKGIIKAAIYTSDTHKNYYMEDVYDGKYASSMTKLTKEIYSLLHDVKAVSFRVF